MTYLRFLPVLLLPFGNLFDLPFGQISSASAIGVLLIIYYYPVPMLKSLALVFSVSLLSTGLYYPILHSFSLLRFCASILFWSPFFILIFYRKSLPTSSILLSNVKQCLLWTTFAVASFYLLIASNSSTSRLSTTYNEPSWYGLFIAALLFANLNISYILTLQNIILLFLLVLTRSTHVFSLILCILLIKIFPSLLLQFKSRNKPFAIRYRLVLYPLTFILISILIYPIIPSYYLERISPLLYSISNLSGYIDVSRFGVGSVSSISFINGFLQAFSVLSTSPLLGLGAGSTGSFTPAFTASSNYLAGTLLNSNDAYSLLFRGTIEFGLIFILISIRLIYKYLFAMHNSVGSSKWILSVGFCLLIGSLVKQPILPSPLVFCSVFILIFIPTTNVSNA